MLCLAILFWFSPGMGFAQLLGKFFGLCPTSIGQRGIDHFSAPVVFRLPDFFSVVVLDFFTLLAVWIITNPDAVFPVTLKLSGGSLLSVRIPLDESALASVSPQNRLTAPHLLPRNPHRFGAGPADVEIWAAVIVEDRIVLFSPLREGEIGGEHDETEEENYREFKKDSSHAGKTVLSEEVLLLL